MLHTIGSVRKISFYARTQVFRIVLTVSLAIILGQFDKPRTFCVLGLMR